MPQEHHPAAVASEPLQPAKTPRRQAARGSTTTARPARGALVIAAAAASALVLAGCGSSAGTSASSSPSSSSSAVGGASSKDAAKKVPYKLHMVFFSRESKISPVIDPQVFVASPGAHAGIGPQMINHVAGVAPAKQAGPPTTPLLGADATPLKITLGNGRRRPAQSHSAA